MCERPIEEYFRGETIFPVSCCLCGLGLIGLGLVCLCVWGGMLVFGRAYKSWVVAIHQVGGVCVSMSLRSVDYSAPFVRCLCHGPRPGVLMPEPHPPECLECVQYAKVANTASWGRLAPALRVTRTMLCGEGIVCSVCGDPVVSLPSLEQWKAGLSAVWRLRRKRLGMTWSNLVPSHFRCWCILGPNQVNTRAGSLALWRKAAAAGAVISDDDGGAELELPASTTQTARPPPTLVLEEVHAIAQHHKVLVRRNEARFGMGTDLTADDLVAAWRAHGGCCAICRDPIELRPLRPSLRQLSWDRWDNSRGYVTNNTRPTCWGCNSAKSTFTMAQCLQVVRQHLAFRAPRHYLLDPGPDFLAEEEEVALVKRLRPFYRTPPEYHV